MKNDKDGAGFESVATRKSYPVPVLDPLIATYSRGIRTLIILRGIPDHPLRPPMYAVSPATMLQCAAEMTVLGATRAPEHPPERRTSAAERLEFA